MVTHCKGEVVCSKYSVLRLTGTNMNVQFNMQIEDAVEFPVPSFPVFHKRDTNMNTETKIFSQIKQQAAVLVRNVPGLLLLSVYHICRIYMCVCT